MRIIKSVKNWWTLISNLYDELNWWYFWDLLVPFSTENTFGNLVDVVVVEGYTYNAKTGGRVYQELILSDHSNPLGVPIVYVIKEINLCTQ